MADTTIVSTANSAMVDYPLALQATGGDSAITYGAQEHMRQLLDAVFQSGGRVTFAGFRVTQRSEGANFSVDVSAGYYVVVGSTDPTNQGKYLIHTTAKVNVATPSAPVSGTRVHRLVAQVRDKAVAGGSNYDWIFWLREDTGTGTPAIPANAGNVATISIASGQSNVQNSHITEDQSQALMPHNHGGITYLKDYANDHAALYSGNPLNNEEYGGYFLPVKVVAGQRYRVECKIRYEYSVEDANIYFYLHLSPTQSGVLSSNRVAVLIPYHGKAGVTYPQIIQGQFTSSVTGTYYITLGVSCGSSGTVTVRRGSPTDLDQNYISLEPIGNNTTDRIEYSSGN